MDKIVFLDRDGVINKKALPQEYVTSWNEFEFLQGVKEGIKRLVDNNYQIFIVTNQRGISRGTMSLEDLEDIHSNMVKEIEEVGGKIEKIYFCPHGYNECNCRKPLPGMLDQARDEFDLKLKESWMVGDSDTDIQVGKARGCKTIYIGEDSNESDYRVNSLRDAVDLIVSF